MRRVSAVNSALKIAAAEQQKLINHIEIDFDNYTFTVAGDIPKTYIPSGSLLEYHKNNKMIGRIIMGPFGSGKSTANCAEILFNSVLIPPMKDGVRRSRWAVIRNTMGELETTTLLTWLDWFRNLGEVTVSKKPILKVSHKFNYNNQPIEMELLFLGLDREPDKQKLDSLEITGAYPNEIRHLSEGVYLHLFGRSGRYPAQDDIDFTVKSPLVDRVVKDGITRHGVRKMVFGDTNPPDVDHWIYNNFEVNKNDVIEIHHQPPALLKDEENNWQDNEKRDNYTHVSLDYYISSAAAHNWDEEYVKVYCLGGYGIISYGKNVFPEYNDGLHCVDEVEIIPDQPVLVGWDFGVTPACLIAQISSTSQLRCIKEFTTERSSVQSLARNFVMPWLSKNMEGYTIISKGDPANPSAQTDLKSCYQVLKEEGIPTRAAITNSIEARLNAVKDHFLTLLEGQPKIIISKFGCPVLRKSLIDKYCYERLRIIGEEKYKDTPIKSHPWSDIVDCLQYICLENARQQKKEPQGAINWSDFNDTIEFN